MTSNCVICGAVRNRKTVLSFHRFPSNKELLQKWLDAVKFTGEKIDKNSKICSNHFRFDDFDDKYWPKRYLLSSAIPNPSTHYHSKMQSTGIDANNVQPSTSHNDATQGSLVLETSSQQLLIHSPEQFINETSTCISQISIAANSSNMVVPSTSQCLSTEASVSVEETCSQQCIQSPIQFLYDSPRYPGDLTASHFSTPRKAKRNLEMIKGALESSRKKIKLMQTQKNRLEKKVKSFKDLLSHLSKTQKISEDAYTQMMDGVPEEIKEIISRQLEAKNKKYPRKIKSFALTLHFYSPRAYSYVRKSFNNLLPHPSTIQKWYSVLDGEPGFTKEAFDALKSKAENKDIIVNITIDEMHIRQFVEWTGTKYEGFVDCGTSCESSILATNVLVFMATAMNDSWKIPLGYFLIKALGSNERVNLIKMCLELLNNSNIACYSVTFDGASCNISTFSKLGCKYTIDNFEPWFCHPVTKEKVFTFWDACHMLKLCRNTLGDKKCLIDDTGKIIKWSFIESLFKLQTSEGLRAANKISQRHINFQNEKMNVRLAAQTLSLSVANAIAFCNFDGGEATSQFCKNINDAFDILNSVNIFAKYKYKEPISVKNYEIFKNRIENLIKYITNLRDAFGSILIETNRKTGFLGFVVCLTNLLNLYDFLICTGKMNYLMTYKLSQDHLETFFSAIRSRGGFNNNPSVRQFKSAYKRLLVHHQISTSPNANCTILDATSLLYLENKPECHTCDIALNSEESSLDYDYIDHLMSLSPFVENIITYISGYVMRKMLMQIKCDDCKNYLMNVNTNQKHLSLLQEQNRGRLVVPHEDIVTICQLTEKLIRFHNEELHLKKTTEIIKLKVLSKVATTFSSPNYENHLKSQNILDNHKIQLIKFCVNLYFKIRLNYECKIKSQKTIRIRHKLSKYILFQNE